jgi:hypothetical protein
VSRLITARNTDLIRHRVGILDAQSTERARRLGDGRIAVALRQHLSLSTHNTKVTSFTHSFQTASHVVVAVEAVEFAGAERRGRCSRRGWLEFGNDMSTHTKHTTIQRQSMMAANTRRSITIECLFTSVGFGVGFGVAGGLQKSGTPVM